MKRSESDTEHGGLPRLLHPLAGPEVLVRILDNLPGMVSHWDADGINRFANDAYIEFFGVRPARLRGLHISEVLGEELYELDREHIEGALAGEPQLFERTMRDISGQVRHLQSSFVPNVVDGEPSGFFVMVSDISARVSAERTLQEAVRQVALLEERQRIAADLHDLVIQRLFAAGLDLVAAQRPGQDTLSRVGSAAVGVDEAIRELRRAIHSLLELSSPAKVPHSVETILGNAARMLGFVPTLTYTGSLEGLSAEKLRDMVAVLNEALANVARHACAGEAEVTIVCADEQLLLRVADDGRGIHGAERNSGLANMRHRAELHGGTFSMRHNDPSGTVIEWMVPVPGR